jgi:dihydroorotate dehydrogenase electron transfer subunit
MKKRVKELEIIEKRFLNADTFLLLLQDDENIETILPGQFVEVMVKNAANTFLRRPISIHDIDAGKKQIVLFIKIVGEGTAQLSTLEKGEKLNIVYPLGNSFSLLGQEKLLLIGGGCGVAPVLYLARYLHAKGLRMDILLGAKSKKDILQIAEYEKYGQVHISTEDGSFGEQGFVTQHSILNCQQGEYAMLYCCGPDAMMHAVAKWAKTKQLPTEVSLENMMACGIGACLCCVTETKSGNQCVCTEGPVFNVNELVWEI